MSLAGKQTECFVSLMAIGFYWSVRQLWIWSSRFHSRNMEKIPGVSWVTRIPNKRCRVQKTECMSASETSVTLISQLIWKVTMTCPVLRTPVWKARSKRLQTVFVHLPVLSLFHSLALKRSRHAVLFYPPKKSMHESRSLLLKNALVGFKR